MSQPDALHLEPDQVAAMIDGTLAGEDRARVVAHLADCATCRQEIAEVQAAQRARPSRVGLWWAGSAAALLAGILLAGPLVSRNDAGPTLRAAPASLDSIEIVEPAGALDLDVSVTFTWRSVAPGSVYTLILMDESAEVVWRLDGVRDTTATLPPDRTLRRGAGYLYVVDARLPDGRTLTSGTRRLGAQQ